MVQVRVTFIHLRILVIFECLVVFGGRIGHPEVVPDECFFGHFARGQPQHHEALAHHVALFFLRSDSQETPVHGVILGFRLIVALIALLRYVICVESDPDASVVLTLTGRLVYNFLLNCHRFHFFQFKIDRIL